MSWLERAKNEIPKSAGLPTANTAETPLLSVTAVPKAGETGIFGIPMAELREVAGSDWPECERDPALFETLAAAVIVRRMRERGEVPPHYTTTTTCKHCGPVPIFPGVPERVEGCPWCLVRAAGRRVPKP